MSRRVASASRPRAPGAKHAAWGLRSLAHGSAALVIALVAACSRDGGQHESSTSEGVTLRDAVSAREAPRSASSPVHAREDAPPAEPPPPAAARRVQFRVARATGGAQHERLPLGARFQVPADSELSLDLVNGARLKLEPGTRAWLLDAEPATLVLLEGSLHAQLPPQGSAAGRPTLRVATADYVVEVPVSGEFWLARPAAKSGGMPARPAYFSQLSGSAELERAPSESDPALRRQQLIAGHAWSGPTPPPALETKGPKTLEDAQKAYRKLRGPALAQSELADPQALLERELAAWAETDERAKGLLQAQRTAKTDGDPAAVQAKQSEIVNLAKEKLALRSRVRFAYEQACERALVKFKEANSDLARFEATYTPKVAPALPSGS